VIEWLFRSFILEDLLLLSSLQETNEVVVKISLDKNRFETMISSLLLFDCSLKLRRKV